MNENMNSGNCHCVECMSLLLQVADGPSLHAVAFGGNFVMDTGRVDVDAGSFTLDTLYGRIRL